MKRKEIERLLPDIFQRSVRRGNPLSAVLEVMEAMHEPSERVLKELDSFFDPRRASEAFVLFLARWVDLERIFDEPERRGTVYPSSSVPISAGIGRLRELIAAAAALSKWRGTRTGLLLFLETATGLDGFTIEEEVTGEDGQPRPFHLLITAPEAARPHQALIERIAEQEKPAYVTYELRFSGKDPRK